MQQGCTPPPPPQDRTATLRELRVSRNKGVAKLHERAGRDKKKTLDDDRARRLEALKANDFEAYQVGGWGGVGWHGVTPGGTQVQ